MPPSWGLMAGRREREKRVATAARAGVSWRARDPGRLPPARRRALRAEAEWRSGSSARYTPHVRGMPSGAGRAFRAVGRRRPRLCLTARGRHYPPDGHRRDGHRAAAAEAGPGEARVRPGRGAGRRRRHGGAGGAPARTGPRSRCRCTSSDYAGHGRRAGRRGPDRAPERCPAAVVEVDNCHETTDDLADKPEKSARFFLAR